MNSAVQILLVYLVILIIVFIAFISILLRYRKHKKDDYIYRDDYTIDDFYIPKEHR